jgi:hypothetical protein
LIEVGEQVRAWGFQPFASELLTSPLLEPGDEVATQRRIFDPGQSEQRVLRSLAAAPLQLSEIARTAEAW